MAKETKFEVEGLGKMVTGLGNLERAFLKQVGNAMFTEAIIVEEESRRRTPVLTGALRASHETRKPVFSNDRVEVEIVVGGPAAPYAVDVHEKVEVPHRTGRSKFLQSAIEDASKDFFDKVSARLDLEGSMK